MWRGIFTWPGTAAGVMCQDLPRARRQRRRAELTGGVGGVGGGGGDEEEVKHALAVGTSK